ncbi:MAG: SDR family oxidoreductase [Myxococcales bacterium]|nr:SDR family oxidoreductase [Myxococcales bacterium]
MSTFSSTLLAGKVAIVTGGGTGIGRAITRALLAHGAQVAIVSRKGEVLERAAEELSEETGQRCLPLVADVRAPEQVEGAIDEAVTVLGGLDIVVNNAAGNFLAPAAELSYRGFRTVVEIDAIGTYNVSKAAFARHFKERGGTILNISATLHYRGSALQVHPSAAKAAVDAMTRTLAIEWGPLGIRVNAIAPGPIADTEGMRRLLPDELRERLERSVPLQRFGSGQDIANAALFLVSDAASFITGAILVVDGGSWMTLPGFEQL